ncbi:MAG: hypothetical protein R3A11_08490 [Bdellovibrionota bacterium]
MKKQFILFFLCIVGFLSSSFAQETQCYIFLLEHQIQETSGKKSSELYEYQVIQKKIGDWTLLDLSDVSECEKKAHEQSLLHRKEKQYTIEWYAYDPQTDARPFGVVDFFSQEDRRPCVLEFLVNPDQPTLQVDFVQLARVRNEELRYAKMAGSLQECQDFVRESLKHVSGVPFYWGLGSRYDKVNFLHKEKLNPFFSYTWVGTYFFDQSQRPFSVRKK